MARLILGLFFASALGGCIEVNMPPTIEVHAVVDVNLKVDKALDDFFGDLDKKADVAKPDAKP